MPVIYHHGTMGGGKVTDRPSIDNQTQNEESL